MSICRLTLVVLLATCATAEAAVLNLGLHCHEKCGWEGVNGHSKHDGYCPLFCGAGGACCKKGIVSLPCDGNIGCIDGQCCVAVAQQPTASVPPTSHAGLPKISSNPPPLPPLSECAIERITFEVLRSGHDLVGDKMYQVAVNVEPWRLDSFVFLTFRQAGLATGRERRIKLTSLTGATLASDAATQDGDVEIRKLSLQLGYGSDASLQPCRFAEVRTGVEGHIIELRDHHKVTSQHADTGTARGEAWLEAWTAGAYECHRGTITLWSYGDMRRDLTRIGCHLPYDPPPPTPPSPPPPPSPSPPLPEPPFLPGVVKPAAPPSVSIPYSLAAAMAHESGHLLVESSPPSMRQRPPNPMFSPLPLPPPSPSPPPPASHMLAITLLGGFGIMAALTVAGVRPNI